MHGAKYEPTLSHQYTTNVEQQELAEYSKETDAKLEAYAQKRMAEMKAKQTTPSEA